MTTKEIAEYATGHGRAAQQAWELRHMLDIVKERDPRVVLEIGSFRGWSLWAWSRVLSPGATLISVDLPSKRAHGDFTTDDKMQEYFVDFDMHYVRKNSGLPETRAEVEEILGGREVEFLFIDGDHSYKGVKTDYTQYSPLVASDGIIGFHDVAHNRHRRCRVIELWNEIKTKYTYAEFSKSARAKYVMGIGVLFLGV
jgi:predicted O-methyltransferase YrrM